MPDEDMMEACALLLDKRMEALGKAIAIFRTRNFSEWEIPASELTEVEMAMADVKRAIARYDELRPPDPPTEKLMPDEKFPPPTPDDLLF